MAKSTRLPRAFYTLSEIAAVTGLGYATVLKMAQRELIPTAHFGMSKTYLVPAAFVDNAVTDTMDAWLKVLAAKGMIPEQEAAQDEAERGN